MDVLNVTPDFTSKINIHVLHVMRYQDVVHVHPLQFPAQHVLLVTTKVHLLHVLHVKQFQVVQQIIAITPIHLVLIVPQVITLKTALVLVVTQ